MSETCRKLTEECWKLSEKCLKLSEIIEKVNKRNVFYAELKCENTTDRSLPDFTTTFSDFSDVGKNVSFVRN